MKKPALLSLALVAVALVACGDDGGSAATTKPPADSSAPGEPSTVELESDPDGEPAYTTDKFTTEAENGLIVVNFSNFIPETHDVVLEGAGGKIVGRTARISDGRDSETISGVKPGTYTFYCSVPGHREAGMEGTLVVE